MHHQFHIDNLNALSKGVIKHAAGEVLLEYEQYAIVSRGRLYCGFVLNIIVFKRHPTLMNMTREIRNRNELEGPTRFSQVNVTVVKKRLCMRA